jgi:hypothetical protein
LTDKYYSLFQRLRLFDAVVTPTMLYGSGSWVMSTVRAQKIRTTQRKMLRAILGKGRRVKEASEDSSEAMTEELEDGEELENWVQWIRRVTHDALESMKKVGINDWVSEQRRRVWRWAGHVARRTDGHWTRKVMMWTPDGQRSRGHPKQRWEDILMEYAERQFGHNRWYEVARSRELWHRWEEAFATERD